LATIGAFLLTSLLIELTPGPNMAYLALVSAVQGRRAGLAATLGVALGLAIIGLAAALGLAALINASPTAFAVLRWGGAAYLGWLAVEAWWGAGEVSPERANLDGDEVKHFRRGLIVNLLNPKAGLFFVAVLPSFVAPEGNLIGQTVLLTALYVAVATGVHLAIVALAGSVNQWFEQPERQTVARRVFAVLLAGVAVYFLWTTRG
jgi:threonine/homoserine/homoserine lactone efflux protein